MPTSQDVKEFLNNLKYTAIFLADWNNLLSAGPYSLASMGTCIIAAYGVDPSVSLAGSTHGLKFTTPINCVNKVSETGIAAFRGAAKNMDVMYHLSGKVIKIMDPIISGIAEFKQRDSRRMFNVNFREFQDWTGQFGKLAVDMTKVFETWEGMIKDLQEAIDDKLYETLAPKPPPSGAPPRGSSILLPAFPPIENPLSESVHNPAAETDLWTIAPELEASARRMYKLLTRDANETSALAFYRTDGREYIKTLKQKIHEQRATIVETEAGHIPYRNRVADTLKALDDAMGRIEDYSTGKSESTAFTKWPERVLRHWAILHAVSKAAVDHLKLAGPVNTWDTDMMDKLYPRLPDASAGTPAESQSGSSSSLVSCSAALNDLRSEVAKLLRFFSALSTTNENIVDIHIKSFNRAVERNQDLETHEPIPEHARGHLIKSAMAIKAYFYMILTVCIMYNQVNSSYISNVLHLLLRLNQHSASNDRVARETALSEYSKNMATKLGIYIDRKKKEIQTQLAATVKEIIADHRQPPAASRPADTITTQLYFTEGAKDYEDRVHVDPVVDNSYQVQVINANAHEDEEDGEYQWDST